MKKFLAPLVAVVASLGLMTAANATKPPEHKVTLCHRTGSATNPYVVITTDIASDGYVKGGHNDHEQVGNGLGGDIIPAYEYTDKYGGVFSYPGKNLDFVFPNGETGAEVLEAGCVLTTDESPTPTPTSSPSDSPTPSPSSTSTSSTPPPTVTITPPSPNGPKKGVVPPKKTAFTGINPWLYVAGGGLLLLGLASLYAARKRSIG